jgi:hypothetical protein
MSMTIYSYKDVSRYEVKKDRTTSEGKHYSLNHPENLVVPMRFKGREKSTSNSQGWERNSSYYFTQLQNSHPEYFGRKNTARISQGTSPRIDAQFTKNFPQYKGYENEVLIHHHVGKDGQAVALPSSVHKGSGEIHIHENRLGITRNAQDFSKRCQVACNEKKELYGKTAGELARTLPSRERTASARTKGSSEVKQVRQTDTTRTRLRCG